MIRLRQAVEIIRGRLAGRTKVQASLYYASSSLVCQAMRFCGLIISTRFIEKAQFGLFAQATLALSFAALLREIGQTNALLSYRGDDRRYAIFNFQLNIALGLTAACALWAVLALAPGLPAELGKAAPLLAAITLAEIATQTGLVMAQKEFRFGMLARVEIAALAAWLTTLVATVSRTEGFLSLICAQLAEILVRFAGVFALSGRRYCGIARGADLNRYYFSQFAAHLVPQNILQTVAGRLDYILLSIFSTRDELGIYERMLQYIRIPWSLSINLIDRVLLVSYSREQNDPEALRKTLRKSTMLVAVAVTSATVAATLAVALLLKFIVGVDWADTILRHWWAALPFTLITPFVWNLNIFCQGTGRAAQLLRNTAFLLAATAIAGGIAAPRFGALGMLAAQGAAFAALLAYQTVAWRRAMAAR